MNQAANSKPQGFLGDQKMLNLCLEGDDGAWEVMVNSYNRRLFSLSCRYTNDRDEAEDLTQEIFIRIYQNLSTFRSDVGSFQNWVLRLGRNLIIDHYRQKRRFRQYGGSEEIEAMNLTDEKVPSPHRNIERDEASRLLRGALKFLSPERKEAIVLRDLEGMGYQEMAEFLGIPEGTVKSRINRARLDLAKLLSQRRVLNEAIAS